MKAEIVQVKTKGGMRSLDRVCMCFALVVASAFGKNT